MLGELLGRHPGGPEALVDLGLVGVEGTGGGGGGVAVEGHPTVPVLVPQVPDHADPGAEHRGAHRVRLRATADLRGGEQHPAPAPLEHRGEGRPHQPELLPEIEVRQPLPGLIGHEDALVGVEQGAGVGHHDVARSRRCRRPSALRGHSRRGRRPSRSWRWRCHRRR